MSDAGCVHMALAVGGNIQAVYERLNQAGARVNAPPSERRERL